MSFEEVLDSLSSQKTGLTSILVASPWVRDDSKMAAGRVWTRADRLPPLAGGWLTTSSGNPPRCKASFTLC
jgi:hypothetical protein